MKIQNSTTNTIKSVRPVHKMLQTNLWQYVKDAKMASFIMINAYQSAQVDTMGCGALLKED